tara:strand:+ start:490 stop:1032 length:543 start_codon:yes stop_codon:yes gene_type:complete
MKKLIVFLLFFSFCELQSQDLVERYKNYIVTQYQDDKIYDLDELTSLKINTEIVVGNDVAYIPLVVNGIFEYFIFDTGCDVGLAISNSLFNKMIDNDKIFYRDYLGDSKMIMANGEFEIMKIIVIDEVLIGKPAGAIRLKNVLTAIYNSEDGTPLLGQDILKRFSSITINNKEKFIDFKK